MAAVLNLNFYDEQRQTIPFHLSIRATEKLIVVNRRDAAGWRREVALPWRFAPRPLSVDLHFSAGRVEVKVDHTLVGIFDALPRPDRTGRLFLRRGFPALKQIAWVETAGALAQDSVRLVELKRSGDAQPGVHLSEAFEVLLRGLPATHAAAGTLRVSGFPEDIPAVLRRLPFPMRSGQPEYALAAVLPGRVWDGGAEALDLVLSDATGRALGTLALDRAQVAARIEALAQSGGFALDDRAALQAIEHARHAGVLAQLTPSARAALGAAADLFGLSRYLAEGRAEGAAETVLIPPSEEPDDPTPLIADRFGAQMRGAPDSDPLALLRTELAALPHAGPLRTALITRVTEWFCLQGRVRDLMALRRELAVPLPTRAADGDLWTLSIQLPLDYAEGQFDRVSKALWQLAPVKPAWISTPAIGWVLEQAAVSAPDLDGNLPLDEARDYIISAALDLIDSRASDYWDRTECRCLMRGTVAVLVALDSLPDWLADRAVAAAARVYGLSPTFWAQIAAAQALSAWVLPTELRTLQDAFAQLSTLIEQGAQTKPEGRRALSLSLALFRQFGARDLVRFRRDLFGPGGVSGDDPAGVQAALVEGLDPAESALRALAFPGAVPPEDPAVLIHARKGLLAANPELVRAPFGAQRAALRAAARRLLAGPAQPVVLAQITTGLSALGGVKGDFLGLTLGLSLARGLLAQERTAEAQALLERVEALAETLARHEERAALATQAAPRQALQSLLHAQGAHPAVARIAAVLDPLLGPDLSVPRDDRTADLWAQADPVQDTLLCLYTCQPNLSTRVQTIRETWLPLLAGMGVPALIFVGGGDGRRDGDVVFLDAPDDYEGLPQKSLAMARWVRDHTRFAHLVKVDDDCFLDPAAWFGDLAHRGVDYYGRRLTRVRGQMDRSWHMPKSRSARGRLELDKSPEPSVYADGGSGYALSRRAMDCLVSAAASPGGQELIHLSFMEDKLVGDLLAKSDIWVDGTDYRVSVLRRTKPGGPLVAAWENGFLPFAGGGVKLAHLDGHERMAEVLAGLSDPLPRPSKIWPSFQPVRLGGRSNTLDLISSAAQLRAVNAAPVAVVACLRNEMFMLPRFFDHYRALGVQGFLMADNGSDDGTFEYLAEQPDVALFSVDTPYNQSHYGVAWQQALMANFRSGRWSLMADADELLLWNADLTGSLPDLVESEDFAGADAARIFMLDMYPQGSLAQADFVSDTPFAQAGFVDRDPFLAASAARGPYSDSPIWTSALRHRLMPGSRAELFVAQKIALLKYRPWMRLSAGLHFVADTKLARRALIFAHFKYNAAFRAKALAEVARRQHFNNAEEYRKYLALVSEGRDVIYDPDVSVPWDQAEFVRRVCAGGGLSGD
ncbi:glycosyltransferase family 2 protein [Pararhodobacter zhoushanensis]|uniref:Glycosyltransferase family 2 protein n=1 Tax=Pararhodobacter zhoushanensis TaxID=2479545 RepID=A0ABT3GVD4_9RHOB|nr:glycosyltransferase family 2 protein [Pararhodobacter zhoushanensis]MCW1931502.1 glycosyltransferase family 2 protein [Pararhodobacter zhoushanensis]